MKVLATKSGAIVALLLLALMLGELWWKVVVLGGQFASAPIYQTVFYTLLPLGSAVLVVWLVWRIAKADWKF